MWWFQWHARRFFRSVMNPMNPEAAIRWHRRLRFLYIFIGMNAAMVGYKYFSKNKDNLKEDRIQDITPAHRKARLMQLGDVHIISGGIGIPTTSYDINSHQYERQLKQKLQNHSNTEPIDNPIISF